MSRNDPYVIEPRSFRELERMVHAQRHELSTLRSRLANLSTNRKAVWMPSTEREIAWVDCSNSTLATSGAAKRILHATLFQIGGTGFTLATGTSGYLELPRNGYYRFGYFIGDAHTDGGSPSTAFDATIQVEIAGDTGTTLETGSDSRTINDVFFQQDISISCTSIFKAEATLPDLPRIYLLLTCAVGAADIQITHVRYWAEFLAEELSS